MMPFNPQQLMQQMMGGGMPPMMGNNNMPNMGNMPNGNMGNLLNQIIGSANPQQMFSQVLNNNPQMSQMLQQIQNSTDGANPKDIAMNLAKQRGIPEDQIMQLFNRFNK